MPSGLAKTSIHTMRYLRAQRGETVSEIALNEGVTVKAVERSLRMVQIDHALNTSEQLEREAIGAVRSNIPHVQRAISKLLNAKTLMRETIMVRGKEVQRIKTVDDSELQLKGVKALTELLVATQPKAPGQQFNLSQNNANTAQAAAATTNIRTTTYEDRLRQIRNQQAEYATLPSQVIDAPEAADEEEDDPLDDEGDDDGDSPPE